MMGRVPAAGLDQYEFCNSHDSPESGYYCQPRGTGGLTKAQKMLNDLPMSQGCKVVEEEPTSLPGSRAQCHEAPAHTDS